MAVSAVGFVEPIRVMFRPAFRIRIWAEKAVAALAPWTARAEPGPDRPVSGASPLGVEAAGGYLPVTEKDGLKHYAAYLTASVVLLLLFAGLVVFLASGRG
jgi:hypothetical protein